MRAVLAQGRLLDLLLGGRGSCRGGLFGLGLEAQIALVVHAVLAEHLHGVLDGVLLGDGLAHLLQVGQLLEFRFLVVLEDHGAVLVGQVQLLERNHRAEQVQDGTSRIGFRILGRRIFLQPRQDGAEDLRVLRVLLLDLLDPELEAGMQLLAGQVLELDVGFLFDAHAVLLEAGRELGDGVLAHAEVVERGLPAQGGFLPGRLGFHHEVEEFVDGGGLRALDRLPILVHLCRDHDLGDELLDIESIGHGQSPLVVVYARIKGS